MLKVELIIDGTPKSCCSKGGSCEKGKYEKIIEDFKKDSAKQIQYEIIDYNDLKENSFNNSKDIIAAVDQGLINLPIVIINGLPRLFGRFDHQDLNEIIK
ncbi:hypothetical protein PRVXH_001065 [Proteinivorax hydrogeniformans]|uniref:Arsenical resistance operon trans-acting repressor ArsD n=1 Tax=Proteinivorax hydrogeniformans TaxID=1826727 RepID=A0AAU8HWD6_9FIRM